MAAVIQPGFGGVPGQSWEARLRQAAYTSTGGTRIRFDYEDVGREFDKRGTQFDFPGVNESYIQQTGHSSRRYPLRCFFSGAQHDLFATAFEAALLEDGIGRLEHPLYGTVDVVPFGTITRRDDLKSAANQSVIEVTFFTTVRAIYPQAQAHPQSEIQAALGAFDVSAAQKFADKMNLAGALNKATAKATSRNFLKSVSTALDKVSTAVTSVNRSFRALQREVNFGMDVLIGQPLLLAQQISNLIKAPGRALTGIQLRLEAYGDLADRIFTSTPGLPEVTLAAGTVLSLRTTKIANDFHISDHFAMSAVSSSASAVVTFPIDENGNEVRGPIFTTKPQALTAAATVLEQFDALVEWRDRGFGALETIPALGAYQVDTGEAYQALQEAVGLTAGFLIQTSFSLIPERRIVLDRPRTIIDLAAELYGSVDDRLDFLINTNNLSGDEILELGRGREIVYYPD